MLQTNLNVIAVGELNFDVLTDSEKRSFFDTLFSRIVEIHKEKQTEAIAISRAEIIAHIRSALQKEPQQMINALVNKVILYNDKIEIYYNYTLRKDPDDRCHGLLFYTGNGAIDVCISFRKVVKQPMEIKLFI